MAELSIKITTKYEQAEKGFNKVTGSVKKYGDELIKARKEGTATRANVEDYVNALNKALVTEDRTKDGMAALTAQSKILGKEIAKMGLAFGDDAGLVKQLEGALKTVEKDMQSMPQTTRKAAAGMKDIEKASGGTANKLLSVAKNILKFQLLMGPITAVIRGFRDTLRDSVNLAAEAEQRFSKLATVFDGMSDSAKAMAQSLAGSLGVANSTAASALSTVGDLLQAQGMGTAESLSTSASWIQQFQDIIAFKDINMSLEEFSQNFMSGAAGNLRNFRTFGSIVKESAVNARLAAQGYDKLTGSQLELAKMTTRAEMALEQQKNAMGATGREWETNLSVSRRLNEAWKEYKENLGDTLNDFLRPMKKVVTDILAQTNKARAAQKLLGQGVQSMNLYNIAENASDYNSFKSEVGGYANQVKKNADTSRIAGFIDKALIKYTASVEDLEALLTSLGITYTNRNGSYTNEWDAIFTNLKMWESQRNKTTSQDKQIADMRTSLLTSAESVDSFIESIASLGNISYTWEEFADQAKALELTFSNLTQESEDFKSLLSGGVDNAISNIFSQIEGLSSDAFANPIDLNFGLNNKEDDYRAWLDEIKEFYAVLYNRQKMFGDVTDETLQSVIKLWGTVNDKLTAYNDSLERAKRISESLSALSSGAGNAATLLSDYNLSKSLNGKYGSDIGGNEYNRIMAQREAEVAYSEALNNIKGSLTNLTDSKWETIQSELISGKYDKWEGISWTTDGKRESIATKEQLQQLIEAKDSYEAWMKSISDYYDTMAAEIEAAAEEKRYAAFTNAYNSITGGTTSYKMQLRQLGMTDDQKALDDLWHGFQKLVDSLDLTEGEIEAMNLAYDEEEKALRELQAATKEAQKEEWRKAFENSLNPVASYIDAYKEGKENFDFKGGGVVALLVELLKNTEAFQTMMSLVQDTIVPILDAILKPMIPALKAVQTMFDAIPWEIVTFFIKIAASSLVIIASVIKVISAVLHNVFEWIKHPVNASKRDIISIGSINDETNALLDKIWKTTTDIERNTDKDNLAVLNDLLARGIINEQQYNAGARVIQKDMVFDPVSARDMNFIAPSAPAARTVSYGGITLNINGGNISEVRRVIYEIFAEQGISYNTAIGG